MLKDNCFLVYYINLLSPNKYEKNEKIILKWKNEKIVKRWKNNIALFVTRIENLKILKYHTFSKKHSFSIVCRKLENEDAKIFKEEESTEILIILGLIKNISLL